MKKDIEFALRLRNRVQCGMGHRKRAECCGIAIGTRLQRAIENEPSADECAERQVEEIRVLLTDAIDKFGDGCGGRVVFDHDW